MWRNSKIVTRRQSLIPNGNSVTKFSEPHEKVLTKQVYRYRLVTKEVYKNRPKAFFEI